MPYNRLVLGVLVVNLAVALLGSHRWGDADSALPALGLLAQANIAPSVLFRQAGLHQRAWAGGHGRTTYLAALTAMRAREVLPPRRAAHRDCGGRVRHSSGSRHRGYTTGCTTDLNSATGSQGGLL